MKLRRLSTPLRWLLTASLALAVARFFSHATHEPLWAWLLDVVLIAALACRLWRDYPGRENWQDRWKRHR